MEREWHKEKIVSIDFDGVLAQYHGFEGIDATGDPMPGAKEFVNQLLQAGYKPMVFTTRPHVVEQWLEKHGFPKLEATNIKRPSVVYIDDRSVQFRGDYDQLVDDLREYNVHWDEDTKIMGDQLQ